MGWHRLIPPRSGNELVVVDASRNFLIIHRLHSFYIFHMVTVNGAKVQTHHLLTDFPFIISAQNRYINLE